MVKWIPVFAVIDESTGSLISVSKDKPINTNDIVRKIGYSTQLEELVQLFDNEDAMRVIKAFAEANR